MKNLAKSLTLDHIIRRGNNNHILRSLRQKIWIYLGAQGINKEQVTYEVDNTRDSKKRKRCHICPSTKDLLYSDICKICKQNICKTHSAIVCLHCEENI